MSLNDFPEYCLPPLGPDGDGLLDARPAGELGHAARRRGRELPGRDHLRRVAQPGPHLHRPRRGVARPPCHCTCGPMGFYNKNVLMSLNASSSYTLAQKTKYEPPCAVLVKGEYALSPVAAEQPLLVPKYQNEVDLK